MGTLVTCRAVSKHFGTRTLFDDLSISFADDERVGFLGPNDAGKTTFLSLVAGLVESDAGTVLIGETPAQESRSGLVFQDYRNSLLPWLNNLDNVAFPLLLRRVSKRQRRRSSRKHLQRLGIDVPLDGYPYQLSGGQQQLIAIARALVLDVDVLLMDEPFGSLDYATRIVVRDTVQHIWAQLQTTVLFVSHNIEEAIYMGDRLVLLSRRPMRILDDIEIPFDHPRTSRILESKQFVRMQAHALRLFQQEVQHCSREFPGVL